MGSMGRKQEGGMLGENWGRVAVGGQRNTKHNQIHV